MKQRRAPLRSEIREAAEAVPMVVPSTLTHVMLREARMWVDDDYGPGWEVKVLDPTSDPASAVAISSRLVGSDRHAPAIDIDYPAMLFPSATPGHSHLYLDVAMPWRTYRRLLKALARAGVIEKDWAKASIKGGQTLLRPPWKAGVGKPAADYTAVTDFHRMVEKQEREERDGYSVYRYDALVPTQDPDAAVYVSSRLHSGPHAPALDLDVPAALIPSSTPGHFHLYLDVEMSWRTYRRLLKALAKAGVIEESWAKASIKSEKTYLAPPWKPKQAARR